MIYQLFFVLIGFSLLLSTKCLRNQTQQIRQDEELCAQNHVRAISNSGVLVCYENNDRDRSILVWFTIAQNLTKQFNSYRFILRSIDELLLSTINIQPLTNSTELDELKNSLRIFNLPTGQYEICVEFESNSTIFIYQPRDGCISMHVGESLHGSFKQTSTQLFLTLATGIIIFFILGLVVQCLKVKQIKKHQQLSIDTRTNSAEQNEEQRPRTISMLSTASLKNQRDRFVRKLFRRHIDQPNESRIRQWARNRAFRHRISTHEQDTERWNKQNLTSRHSQDNHLSSIQTITTNDINPIPMNESSQKTSFYLTRTDEYEMI